MTVNERGADKDTSLPSLVKASRMTAGNYGVGEVRRTIRNSMVAR